MCTSNAPVRMHARWVRVYHVYIWFPIPVILYRFTRAPGTTLNYRKLKQNLMYSLGLCRHLRWCVSPLKLPCAREGSGIDFEAVCCRPPFPLIQAIFFMFSGAGTLRTRFGLVAALGGKRRHCFCTPYVDMISRHACYLGDERSTKKQPECVCLFLVLN